MTLRQPTLQITCTFWEKVIKCIKCWIIHCYHVQHVVHVMLCRCYVVHVHVHVHVIVSGSARWNVFVNGINTEKVLYY